MNIYLVYFWEKYECRVLVGIYSTYEKAKIREKDYKKFKYVDGADIDVLKLDKNFKYVE